MIPLVGGILTRITVTKNRGKDYLENVFVHKFDNVTTVGLLLTLIIIFSSQAEVILSNPFHIVLIAVPLIIQTFVIFFLAYGACRVIRLPFDVAAPAGMIGASNFFELAVAVAIALFGTTSPAALATTVGVLTEVPVMLTLVKIANRTKGGFPMANKKVAFICTHNACRSQIAEALAKHMGIEGYEFYSAGSIPQKQIDQDAVRIMKNEFGIDMSGQYSKTVQDIPKPDIAISMGCGVRCPYIGRAFDDDWGLEDPTGKSDEAYLAVIQQIQERLKQFR